MRSASIRTKSIIMVSCCWSKQYCRMATAIGSTFPAAVAGGAGCGFGVVHVVGAGCASRWCGGCAGCGAAVSDGGVRCTVPAAFDGGAGVSDADGDATGNAGGGGGADADATGNAGGGGGAPFGPWGHWSSRPSNSYESRHL